MADPIPERPIDVSFQDALICLHDEIKKYLRSRPGLYSLSRDECLSIVYESFLQAYYGHDPSKGSFLRRVRAIARYSLTDHLRKERNKIKPIQDNGVLNLVPQKSSFNLTEFVRSLSPDADKILWVARHLEDMERVPEDRKKEVLITVLLERGWSGDRIVEAFQEITHKLAEWTHD